MVVNDVYYDRFDYEIVFEDFRIWFDYYEKVNDLIVMCFIIIFFSMF